MGQARGPVLPNSKLLLGQRLDKTCRTFFHCLICVFDWFRDGLQQLSRTAPVAFYKLLLAARSPAERNSIPIGCRAAAYEAALVQIRKNEQPLRFEDVGNRGARSTPALQDATVGEGDGASDIALSQPSPDGDGPCTSALVDNLDEDGSMAAAHVDEANASDDSSGSSSGSSSDSGSSASSSSGRSTDSGTESDAKSAEALGEASDDGGGGTAGPATLSSNRKWPKILEGCSRSPQSHPKDHGSPACRRASDVAFGVHVTVLQKKHQEISATNGPTQGPGSLLVLQGPVGALRWWWPRGAGNSGSFGPFGSFYLVLSFAETRHINTSHLTLAPRLCFLWHCGLGN